MNRGRCKKKDYRILNLFSSKNESMINPLKKMYEEFWVPVFGRLLMTFSTLIEGEKPKGKQTYDLREKDSK